MTAQGNILFCGVGGQGILLASEITAHALLAAGLDVKKSEVHGMAQRGGSVVAHLRFGAKVWSPLIDPGRADLVVAFEMLEAGRYLPFMHEKSRLVVNTHTILPPAVATGKMSYPTDVLDQLRSRGLALTAVDAFAVAKEIGEPRAANVVLVGMLSTWLPVPEETFIKVIESRLPARIREVNIKAFREGRRLAAES